MEQQSKIHTMAIKTLDQEVRGAAWFHKNEKACAIGPPAGSEDGKYSP